MSKNGEQICSPFFYYLPTFYFWDWFCKVLNRVRPAVQTRFSTL